MFDKTRDRHHDRTRPERLHSALLGHVLGHDASSRGKSCDISTLDVPLAEREGFEPTPHFALKKMKSYPGCLEIETGLQSIRRSERVSKSTKLSIV